jgi:hypothetical protein
MRRLAAPALLFVAIGLLLYAALFWASERLLYRTGHANPLFKVATAPAAELDWVILGASHAMPLDFGDFNAGMERQLGLRILNLASPGTGPLYNRFVLEGFLRRHRARNLLYALDSFAFYSRAWNEDRFADAKLLRRTPLELATAGRLWDYSRREGVDFRAVLDHLSGFSKINNPERFQRDVWEGEAQFDRVHRPSAAAVRKRIAYLYPDQAPPEELARYLGELSALVEEAQRAGMNVVAIKMPLPAGYRGQLPGEAAFDAAAGAALAARGVTLRDFSGSLDEPRCYFDTDHLNREGLTRFVARDLGPLLRAGRGRGSPGGGAR